MRTFKKDEVLSILKLLKEHYDNILFEVWALNYHMNTQRSETMIMTPMERRFWLEELIKQRNKENQELNKK